MIHMGFIEFQRCDDDDGQMVMTSDFEKKKESEFRGRWLLLLLLGVGGDLILFSIQRTNLLREIMKANCMLFGFYLD